MVGVFLVSGIFLKHDYFQFAVAILLKIGWATTILLQWLSRGFHSPVGWNLPVTYYSLAALVFIIAFWQENE